MALPRREGRQLGLQGVCQGFDRVVDLVRSQGQPQGAKSFLRGRLWVGWGQPPAGEVRQAHSALPKGPAGERFRGVATLALSRGTTG